MTSSILPSVDKMQYSWRYMIIMSCMLWIFDLSIHLRNAQVTPGKKSVLCLFVWAVSESVSVRVVPVLCWEQEYQVSSVCTMCAQCFLCVLPLSAQSSATSKQHASLLLPSECVCARVTGRTQCADFYWTGFNLTAGHLLILSGNTLTPQDYADGLSC